MHPPALHPPSLLQRFGVLLIVGLLTGPAPSAMGQQAPAPGDPDRLADEALAQPPAEPLAEAITNEASAPLLSLLLKGGWLMAPIVLMSLLVVAVTIERLLGLRRSRVAPRSLERGLRQLADVGDFEPRAAYRLCQTRPSAAGRCVAALVTGAGRPHAEIIASAADAVQREADRMYNRVRTLNLAAAVTPLMGLLGTVWGMIAAFFATARLPLGSNKGQVLAEGIYVALVTTFAGLAVAIPAAVLAHYFEGRILRLTRSIEELLAELMPRMERFESGPRFDPSRPEAADPPAMPAPLDGADWAHASPPAPHETLGPAAPRRTPESRAEPWQS